MEAASRALRYSRTIKEFTSFGKRWRNLNYLIMGLIVVALLTGLGCQSYLRSDDIADLMIGVVCAILLLFALAAICVCYVERHTVREDARRAGAHCARINYFGFVGGGRGKLRISVNTPHGQIDLPWLTETEAYLAHLGFRLAGLNVDAF